MLEKLLHVNSELLISHHFCTEERDIAQKKITQTINKYRASNSKAHSLLEELTQCQDDLASERITVGYHQNTIMIFSDQLNTLEEKLHQVCNVYDSVGFRLTTSVLALEPLFWSQLPGNQHMMTHRSIITNENLADFCPLFNYITHQHHKTHLSHPIAIVKTRSHTPCFFHYHASGSGDLNDLTTGHTTIIGGNGSGKTVLMGFMDTYISCFDGRSFFFDRNRGMELYVRAMQGNYFRLTADDQHENRLMLNPFQLDDTPSNRNFLKTWITVLLTENQHQTLSAEAHLMLDQCIDFLYNEIDPKLRCLTAAVKRLPINFSHHAHLKKWIRGYEHIPDGQYAWLFDNPRDNFTTNTTQKIGIDLTYLLHQSPHILIATCMYLMHRIKLSLNGQLTSILFDEGWQILDHPYWKQQLRQDLPTLRKLNAHIVLSTQSPSSVLHSSLSAQFLDNCATHIFFCNPAANWEHYQHFGLNKREFDFIKNTPKEQKLWLYKQDNHSVICQLPLHNMRKALNIWSANQRLLNRLEQLSKNSKNQKISWQQFCEE